MSLHTRWCRVEELGVQGKEAATAPGGSVVGQVGIDAHVSPGVSRQEEQPGALDQAVRGHHIHIVKVLAPRAFIVQGVQSSGIHSFFKTGHFCAEK